MPDTGAKYCGTGANYNDGGTTAWSNPTNIQGDTTSTAATCAPPSNGNTSQVLRASGFGFNVPAGATILGVLVELERQASANTRFYDTTIKLLKAGAETGNNKSAGASWTNSKAFASFGGAADMWGATLTADDVNAAGFGVSFKGTRNSSSSVTASAYRVRVTVYYSSSQSVTPAGGIILGGTVTVQTGTGRSVSPAGGLVLGGAVTVTGTVDVRTRLAYGAYPTSDDGLSGALGAGWSGAAYGQANAAAINRSGFASSNEFNPAGGAYTAEQITGGDFVVRVTVGHSDWGWGNNHEFSLLFGDDTAGTHGYRLGCVNHPGGGWSDIILYRRNAGETQLNWGTDGPYAEGDTFVIRKVGNQVSVRRQRAGAWATLYTVTDAVPQNVNGYGGLIVSDRKHRLRDFGVGAAGASFPDDLPAVDDAFGRGQKAGRYSDYGSNVVIEGLTFRDVAADKWAILIEHATNVTIRDCDFVNVDSAIKLDTCTGTLTIERCRMLGSTAASFGGLVQLANCTMQGRIADNDQEGGQTEDVISIYLSQGVDAAHPIVIEHNRLHGTDWTSLSGCGINIGDGTAGSMGACYVIARANLIHTAGQVGLGVSGGHDITLDGNVVYATPNRSFTTHGISVANWTGTPNPSGIHVLRNRVNWVNRDGDQDDYYDRGDMGTVELADNTWADATIVPSSLLPRFPTANPGIVLGGSPGTARARSITPAGGIVLGGTVTVQTGSGQVAAPAGGLVLGGTVSTTRARSSAPAGGLVLGGTASTSRSRSSSPAGGLQLGGAATTSRARAVSPAGGLQLAGAAATTRARSSTPAGGLVLGGTASTTRSRSSSPAGGLQLGGTATTSRIRALSPAGGLQLGGTASTTRSRSSSPAGGLQLGGTASTTRSRSSSPAGGIILAGTIAVTWTGGANYTPAGGIRLGGTATISATVTRTTAGGLILNGAANAAPSRSTSPTGGIRLAGAAATTRARSSAPAGGLILGGAATASRAEGAARTGGIRLAGTVTVTATATVTRTGGIRLDGAATTLAELDLAPAGGIRLAGAAASRTGRTITVAGGLILGGATRVVGGHAGPPGTATVGSHGRGHARLSSRRAGPGALAASRAAGRADVDSGR